MAAQATYRAAEDAIESTPDVAFPLYCEAFQQFFNLYNDHPQGFSSDTCLRHIRLIGWTLWRADRRRFSISSAIDLPAAEVACQCDDSYAPAWSTLARCYFGLGRTREGEEACQTATQHTGFAYRPQGDLLLLGRYGEAEPRLRVLVWLVCIRGIPNLDRRPAWS